MGEQELSWGYVTPEMLGKQPSGNAARAAGHAGLELDRRDAHVRRGSKDVMCEARRR